MTLDQLRKKIEHKDACLAVIGLGYVGLPVACMFAEKGFDVLGIEILPERVAKINAGISPIEGEEPGLESLLAKVTNRGHLRASSDYQDLSDRDVILIDVETPVDENNIPRYNALRAATRSLGSVLQAGSLVVVESTIAPGTIHNVVKPLLEGSSGRKLNEGFYLGNCPERVMPGKLLVNLRTMSRVVGGMTPETAETMVLLYRHIVQADLDPTDSVTAELVKTAENAYRDVQIAFANEVALICQAVGGDVWKVRQLVNKSPFRQMHLPGAGVGGHCIPKDPWLLAYGVQQAAADQQEVPLRLIPAARAVNDSMPHNIANLLQDALHSAGRELAGARILVLGYAYLEDSDDTRNSPSEALVERLKKMKAEVVIHDPYVPEYQGELEQLARNADAAVLMVAHSQYKKLDLNGLKNLLRTPVFIDGRGVFSTAQLKHAGWTYRIIGVSG
ncbi:MAG: nucleotide sugar dehydrogenase [Anaerolineales bacterium]|nr:nucleotide sugar dehydrogenase [Anaerolineales bacterium]